MRAHAVILSALALSSSASGGPAATAATAVADGMIREANARAREGDFVGAAARFRDAYATDPRPELICNVGVAYNKAHDLPRAHRFLAECVRGGGGTLDAGFMAAVADAIAAIDSKLRAGSYAPVHIMVLPDGAAFTISDANGDDRFVGSQLVWLPFGDHTLSTRAEGYVTDTRPLPIDSQAPLVFPVHLVRVPAVVPPPPVTSSPGTPPPIAKMRATIMPATPSRTAFYVGAAVSAVGLAISVATYVEARHAINAVDVNGAQATYDAEAASARSWRTSFEISLGAASIAAAVTGYLWLHMRPRPAVELAVMPVGDGAAAIVSGAF